MSDKYFILTHQCGSVIPQHDFETAPDNSYQFSLEEAQAKLRSVSDLMKPVAVPVEYIEGRLEELFPSDDYFILTHQTGLAIRQHDFEFAQDGSFDFSLEDAKKKLSSFPDYMIPIALPAGYIDGKVNELFPKD